MFVYATMTDDASLNPIGSTRRFRQERSGKSGRTEDSGIHSICVPIHSGMHSFIRASPFIRFFPATHNPTEHNHFQIYVSMHFTFGSLKRRTQFGFLSARHNCPQSLRQTNPIRFGAKPCGSSQRKERAHGKQPGGTFLSHIALR